MPASAAATIIFHHLDPATEPAVRELLIEQSFRPWFHEPMTATLHTNTGYGHLHADLEVCARMRHAIRELDPSAVFEICEDPGENFAGRRIVFHPEFGEHHSAGSRDGAALLDADLVLVHIERVRAALDTGTATWSAATASTARTTRADGRAVTPPTPPTTTPRS